MRKLNVRNNAIQAGKRYRFRLDDVICPDRQQIVVQITPNLEVAGQVMFLSDSGDEPEAFAVMEVEGIGSPVIIPVEKLQPEIAEGLRSSRDAERSHPTVTNGLKRTAME